MKTPTTVEEVLNNNPICNAIRRLGYEHNRTNTVSIKDRIFYLLQESNGPMTFYELREKLRHKIGDKKHPNRPITEGIDSLIKEGIPIKTLNRDTDLSYFLDKKEYKKLKELCEDIEGIKTVYLAESLYRIFE